MPRITAADMEAAAEWCASYDDLGDDDVRDEKAESIHRVAAWLREEAAKREKEAAIRAIAREKGVTPATVRAHIAIRAAS